MLLLRAFLANKPRERWRWERSGEKASCWRHSHGCARFAEITLPFSFSSIFHP
jgi:sarcosine oxidase delta subunit